MKQNNVLGARLLIQAAILSLLALLITNNAWSQAGIKGIVQSELKERILNATVHITGKAVDRATTTNDSGYFYFENLDEGRYEISVSYTGFKTYSESLFIGKSFDSKQIVILLTSITPTLQKVEVVGRLAKNYTIDYSFSATRTAILNKDLPQSIGTVTKELIADRQAFQLADAIKIIPGVVPSSFYNQYTIRGISQNEEGQILNGMRTRQYYFLQPITSNIERVEVIKGAASATFASVDPGGSINMVTKKPLATDRKEVSFTAGSFSTIRGTIDFTGPLNKEKTLLYRLNGAYQQAKSYRDLVNNNSLLLSPSFSYIPNDKTAINVEMILSNMDGNLDRGQPIFGAVAGATNLNSTPVTLNLGADNDYFKSKELIIMSNLSHKFTRTVSLNISYMKQTWKEDLQEHRTTNAFAPDISGNPVNSLVGMQFVQRQQNWNIDNLNNYFNFDFATGGVKHQLLVGYDLQRWQKLKGGGQNAARGFLLKDGTVAGSFVTANAANYQTITYGNLILPKPNVRHFDLNNPSYTLSSINDYIMNSRTAIPAALTTTNAIYIQEQLRWNRFILLLSLRQDWFKDITNFKAPGKLAFTNSKLLPRIGLTYSITERVNVYGTYLQGYQPQSNTATLMPNTGNYLWTAQSAARFKPLISDLKELGVKALAFKGRMHVNAAVYEINQENILLNANLPEYPDSLITRGAERSRGFEVEAAGYILPDWQINASYSYIDAKILADNDSTLVGGRKQNTPVNSANFWTRFNFSGNTVFRDIGLGLGMQYNGSRLPWFTRAFEVPSYTLLDMALYYTPAKSNMQIAINVNNLFNKTYWLGAQNYTRLFPGAPRNIMCTATYRF